MEQPDYASRSTPVKEPRASYPPYMVEVGIGAMLVGAFAGGIVLPCSGLYYSLKVYDDGGSRCFGRLCC